MTTDLQALHKTIWDFRAEMNGRWPTPTSVDSLRYAFCEVAESLDAFLREARPGDKRNNDRNVSVAAELADAAIMFLTALGPDWHEFPKPDVSHGFCPDLDRICFRSGSVLEYAKRGVCGWSGYALELVRDIDRYVKGRHRTDLGAEVQERLERIREKHGQGRKVEP